MLMKIFPIYTPEQLSVRASHDLCQGREEMQHDGGLLQNQRPPDSDPCPEAGGPDPYCLVDPRHDNIGAPNLCTRPKSED